MNSRLRSDKPAFYHIKIQGDLSPKWSDYLGGLDISVTNEPGGPQTILEGELQDQAAAMGVLDSLYNLGYLILEIVCQPSLSET
jgi:hypothetical protein